MIAINAETQGALVGVSAMLVGWMVTKIGQYAKLKIDSLIDLRLKRNGNGKAIMNQIKDLRCGAHEEFAESLTRTKVMLEQCIERLKETKELVSDGFKEMKEIFNRHVDNTDKIHIEMFDRINELERNV